MRTVFLIVVMAACCSCKKSATEYPDDVYYFTQVQPVGKDSLLNMPKKFLGYYLSDYGDTLQISRDEIAYSIYTEFAISKKDSFFDKYKGDERLFMRALQDSLKPDMRIVKQDLDSIYLCSTNRVTLFSFTRHTAKFISGDFITNTKDSIYWHVAAYSLKKESLNIKRFSGKEDLAIVKSVVKDVQVNADTSKIIVNPTKQEFKCLLKSDAGSVQSFRKIN